jgi:hypothetical protein
MELTEPQILVVMVEIPLSPALIPWEVELEVEVHITHPTPTFQDLYSDLVEVEVEVEPAIQEQVLVVTEAVGAESWVFQQIRSP